MKNQRPTKQFLNTISCLENGVYSAAIRGQKSNISIATGLLSEFSMRSIEKIRWRDPDLVGIVQKLKKTTRFSSKIISRQFPVSRLRDLDTRLSDVGKFMGGSGLPFHGLSAADKVFIPKLQEPQATQGLVDCLVAGPPSLQRQKLIIFLNALPIAPERVAEFERLSLNKNFSCHVAAEVQTHNGKRIDILIDWQCGDISGAVAIEAKFNHKVTAGQLPAYRQYCKRKFNTYDLILLTLDGSRSTRNKDWKPVSWLSLLIRMEKQLSDAQYTNSVFASYRAMLWHRIKGEK